MNTDISAYLASGRSIREAPPGIAYGAGKIKLSAEASAELRPLKVLPPRPKPVKAMW